jgi:hypothetical protein
MAIGKASDFQIYQEQFFGGVVEALEQNSNAFNAASMNSIRLMPRIMRGYYEQESFMKEITSLIGRRDTTSVAAVSDTAMTQGEYVGVKLNRRIGPVANTLDSFRKISRDPGEMSFLLGQQTGQAIALDYLNSGLNALEAALSGQTALNYNAISGAASGERTTLDHINLVRAMAKMGDASNRIVAWVMHSKPFFDLMQNTISDKIFNVANVTVYQGTVASFNRPVIVTDSSSLLTATSSDTDYHVLGLVEDALLIEESEEREIVSEVVTGLANLVMRIQGEYAFNVRIKGMAWDIQNGGANPTDGALGTSTNWDKIATDNRNLPGVRLTVD